MLDDIFNLEKGYATRLLLIAGTLVVQHFSARVVLRVSVQLF